MIVVVVCRNVHTISVHTISSMDKLWPRYAAALAQQRLPALRELHMQHSSNTDVSLLEQLRTILQVGEQPTWQEVANLSTT
jgi:DNA-binding transcriptional regulator YbjK